MLCQTHCSLVRWLSPRSTTAVKPQVSSLNLTPRYNLTPILLNYKKRNNMSPHVEGVSYLPEGITECTNLLSVAESFLSSSILLYIERTSCLGCAVTFSTSSELPTNMTEKLEWLACALLFPLSLQLFHCVCVSVRPVCTCMYNIYAL